MKNKNVTFSIDDELLKKVRKAAAQINKPLPELIREFLKNIVRDYEGIDPLSKMKQLLKEKPIATGGTKWEREDLYER
ncbi:MAG: ribbon-helix-helix protein, CopG family [bacterium]